MQSIALLLIAHGSRRAEANADLEHLARQLRPDPMFVHVQPSYLELCEPTIHAGGVHCVTAGANLVVLVPYFLSAGVHVVQDLTEARDHLAKAYPHVEFRLAEPLGRHPLLANIVAERVTQALVGENG